MTRIVHVLDPGEECEHAWCGDHLPRPQRTFLEREEWTTREGVTLKVSEMGPRHALHSYHMVHRRAKRLAWAQMMHDVTSPWAPQGEMAQDAVERMHDEMMRRPHSWLDETPLMRALWSRACEGFAVQI